MAKFVYLFSEGNKDMRDLLGGKGANLAEMTKIGLPVPQGFTVTTEACTQYYQDGGKVSDSIREEIFKNVEELEKISGKQFGSVENPLLLSVRSGAKFSMPGMMDTVLNLGLNDDAVEGIAKLTGNKKFAYDSYRRFIQMFGDVVLEVHKEKYDEHLEAVKEKYNCEFDTDLTEDHLLEVIEGYKKITEEVHGKPFPQDPREQLYMSVSAVFRSWNNPRANIYRKLNDIPHHIGTAVNVQIMVFGNMGETCGTGVAFTRNPSTGENLLYGEFLMNAQGEDVVAGIRTPQPISQLDEVMPEAYKQFVETCNTLENHYKDMQDIEFTIENKKLFILQTRNGKRTSFAAVKIAVDMVAEGLINEEVAVTRVEPNQIDQLLHPTFDEAEIKKAKQIAKGLPASPGAAFGKVYFTADAVVKAAEAGEKVILVRTETSPEDIEGMVSAQGILTARGGMTSHAAVVARGMGKCCVAGCGEIKVTEKEKIFKIGDKIYKEGDSISLDGSAGTVYEGEVKTKPVEFSGEFAKLMEWADRFRTLTVRTNADTPKDSAVAVKFGAQGIGLCRTEHMFFEEERIMSVREMIVAKNKEDRQKAINKLFPYQKADFVGIFEAMGERPVNIRLLDPPLHEFLPHEDKDIEELAKELEISAEELKSTVESLNEFNPMLGHRGCRLGVTYPEIYEMQVKAIMAAAIEVKQTKGIDVKPEIMIPLVGHVNELEMLRKMAVETCDAMLNEAAVAVNYQVGTMIEVPRAALTADEVATQADFFSFGTNDLTQMTFGFSRDDAGKFISEYIDKKVFEKDPFQALDQVGVGKLVKMACELGRSVKPNLKLGICGEHGGEPSSIDFCHRVGLDYVSCSPYRVPIARLAAAQAAIRNK